VASSANSTGSTSNSVNFPGAHPSSEGKRRRNRSNVEAMTAKHFQDDNNDNDQSTTLNNGKSIIFAFEFSRQNLGPLRHQNIDASVLYEAGKKDQRSATLISMISYHDSTYMGEGGGPRFGTSIKD
jgi:hypothetical protein